MGEWVDGWVTAEVLRKFSCTSFGCDRSGTPLNRTRLHSKRPPTSAAAMIFLLGTEARAVRIMDTMAQMTRSMPMIMRSAAIDSVAADAQHRGKEV